MLPLVCEIYFNCINQKLLTGWNMYAQVRKMSQNCLCTCHLMFLGKIFLVIIGSISIYDSELPGLAYIMLLTLT